MVMLGGNNGNLYIKPKATTFDGSPATYLRAPSLVGQHSTDRFTLWVAYRQEVELTNLFGGEANLYLVNDSVSQAQLIFSIRSVGGGGQITQTIAAVNPLNDWSYLVMSVNTSGISRYIHWGGNLGNKISGVLSTIPTDGRSLDMGLTDGWNVGYKGTNFGTGFEGQMAVFGIDIDNAVDLTSSVVQERFVKADGTIVIDSGNGSKYTGSQPILYLKGGASSFINNRGTGGPLTATGVFTTYVGEARIDP